MYWPIQHARVQLPQLRNIGKHGGRHACCDDGANVYDQDARDGGDEALLPEAINEIVNSTLEPKDYYVGEMAQKSAESCALEHIIFGPNQPALHHFHANYREDLDLPPLEQL